MSDQAMTARTLDASAITLSALCVVHCLALPVLAAALPVMGVLAGAEWVHKLFVLIALPISGFAIARSLKTGGGEVFTFLALAGLTLLLSAAFLEQLHRLETGLTVTGALLLAGSHFWRWSRHKARSRHSA